MIEFPLTLMALAGIALVMRSWGAALVATILLLNWIACDAFSRMIGNSVSWLGLASIDFVTVVALILAFEAGWARSRGTLLVLAVYAFQLVSHVGYGFTGPSPHADYYYYWVLAYSAWAQAAILGGWAGANILRGLRLRAHPDGGGKASSILRRSGDGQ